MMDTDMGLADLLPQPYRLISEIIELDILDIGWLAILRRHPEINLDASGNPAPVKRNHGLLHTVNSTIKKDIAVDTLPSAFFHIRVNSKRGTSDCEDWLCLVDVNGMLRITRNNDNSEIISESLLKPSPSSAEASAVPVEEANESQTTLRFDSYVVAQPSHPHRDPVLRLVFHDLVTVKTPRIVEGGKKGKAEEVPQFDVSMHYRFVIVDISQSAPGVGVGVGIAGSTGDRKEKVESWSITRRMEIRQDSLDERVGRSKEMMCSADFSSDARSLLLSTAGGSEAGVRLFHMPDPFSTISDNAAAPEEPALVFQLEHNSKLLNGSAVLKAFLIPPALSVPAAVPSPSSNSAPPSDLGPILPDVVVTLRANTVLLLGLRPNPDFAHQLAQQQQQQEEAKKKKDSKDKDATPPPLPLPVSCFLAGQWSLTSSCSASILCDARRMLVLGLVDGSVAFWQLPDRRCLGTAAAHPGQVTALCDLDGSSSQAAVLGPGPGPASAGQRPGRSDGGAGDVTVVSAASDGSICVFSPRPAASSPLLLGSSLGPGGAAVMDSPLGLPPLRDYRYDVAGSGVVALLPLPGQPNPTSSPAAKGFFAQYSCGTVAAYEWRPDLGGLELKGSLSKTEKDPLQPLNRIALAPCTVQAVQEQHHQLKLMQQRLAELAAAEAAASEPTAGVGQPSDGVSPAAEGAQGDAGDDSLSMHRFIAAAAVGQQGCLQLYCTLREEAGPPGQGPGPGRTVLASYPLSAFGGVFSSAADGAEDRFDDWAVDSYINGNVPSKPFKASSKQTTAKASSKPSSSTSMKGTSVHSAVSASSSMKLTVKRLAAFTESQAPSQSSKDSKLRGARTQLKQQPLLPDKAVLHDLLNSKLERTGRKTKLVNNLKDLLTYM